MRHTARSCSSRPSRPSRHRPAHAHAARRTRAAGARAHRLSPGDPGFVDLVLHKTADIVRVYFPPDGNTLLWSTDHGLRTYDRINVIVAGKQPAPQWLAINQAAAHCDVGIGVWPWAGTETEGADVDVVMACAGDVPTLETLAAVDLLRQRIP